MILAREITCNLDGSFSESIWYSLVIPVSRVVSCQFVQEFRLVRKGTLKRTGDISKDYHGEIFDVIIMIVSRFET